MTAAFATRLPNPICHAVRDRFGFARAPMFLVHRQIAAGEMVLLFSEEPMPTPLYMIRAGRSQGASRKVEVFVGRHVAELARIPGFRLAAGLRIQAGA